MNAELHAEIFEHYIDMKQQTFLADEPLPFIVNYFAKDDETIYTCLLPGRSELERCIATMLVRLGPPYAISVLSDLWVSQPKTGEVREYGIPEPQPGMLEKAFLAGDMTIGEAIVMVVCEGKEISAVQRDYHVDDDGNLVFDPIYATSHADGRIAQVLYSACQLTPETMKDVVDEILGDIYDDPE